MPSFPATQSARGTESAPARDPVPRAGCARRRRGGRGVAGLALAWLLLCALPTTAQARGADALKAGVDSARSLAGANPGEARRKLEALRRDAIAQGRSAWRLTIDELDCRLLSDIDPQQGLAVAQAGLASAGVPPATLATQAQSESLLPLLRLQACHAGLQLDLGHEAEGQAALEAVLAVANTPELEPGRAMALLERGLHRSRRGDYVHGQSDLLAACAALRAAAPLFDRELCTWHLANHFKRVGDHDEALNLLQPLLDGARRRGARQDEGIYLYGIAQVQSEREDWSRALTSYGDALAIETAKGDALGIAYAEFGAADALTKLGRATEALPRLRRALAQFDTLGDRIQSARANVLLANALLRLDQPAEAQLALQRADSGMRGSADEVLKSEWLGPHSELMARLGQWREAHAALAARAEIDKRLHKRQLSQQTARLRMQYNREHDEQDIRTLQLANQQGQDLRQLQAVALTLFVLLLAATLAYAGHKVRESRRLRTLSLSDELTGLPNRRAAMAQLHAAIVTARERTAPLSVMMIDVDHFKQVNDRHGHAAGDDVLRHLAKLLPTSLRSLDRLGRIGGEEFLAVLPDATLQQAAAIAERMRASLATTPAATGVGPVSITASIGVACLQAGETLGALIDRADQALYAAKHGGRNAVAQARD